MAEKTAKKARKKGNGEGCISQRKAGTWVAVVTTGYDDNGKQKRKFFYGKTRKEVANKLHEALEQQKQGYAITTDKYTVAQWITNWLWSYKHNNIKPRTFHTYVKSFDLYLKPTIGNIQLGKLCTDHVQKMVVNKMHSDNLSRETIKLAKLVLSSALKQAMNNKLIRFNACAGITLPRQVAIKKDKALTIEEQAKFQEVIKKDAMYPAFLTMLYTGIRIGELRALKWENVDFSEKNIEIIENVQRLSLYDEKTKEKLKSKHVFGTPKSQKGVRTIPIHPELSPELKKHKKKQNEKILSLGGFYNNQGLVFANDKGNPIEQQTFSKKFKDLLKKAGIDRKLSLHSLRHTFATRGLESGIELKVMQELLGHSSIVMTADTYSHVQSNQKRASIDKLNFAL